MKPLRIIGQSGTRYLVNPAKVQWACSAELDDETEGVDVSIAGAHREVSARHTLDEFEAMWADALRDDARGVVP